MRHGIAGLLGAWWQKWSYRGQRRVQEDRDWRPAVFITAGALLVGGIVATISLLIR